MSFPVPLLPVLGASTNFQTGDEFPRNILCVSSDGVSANMFRLEINVNQTTELSHPKSLPTQILCKLEKEIEQLLPGAQSDVPSTF